MTTVIAFVVVAAVGAIVRWDAGRRLTPPAGTFVVNVVGSFALGFSWGWTGPAATVLALGGLGSLTTFSTLTSEVVEEWAVRPRRAWGYLLVTLGVGIAAAAAGLALG